MATIEFIRDAMRDAEAIMNDSSMELEKRRAASSRFWHCYRRLTAMDYGCRTKDEPGHYMRGYSEEGYSCRKSAESRVEPDARRAYLDRKSAVQIAARDRL